MRIAIAMTVLLSSGCFRHHADSAESKPPDDSHKLGCDAVRDLALPVDGALTLPQPLVATGDGWSGALSAAGVGAVGQLTGLWEFDKRCRPGDSRLAYDGTAHGQASITATLDRDLEIAGFAPDTGWHSVTVPAGPIPVMIWARAGVRVDATVDVEGGVELALDARAGSEGLAELASKDGKWSVVLPELELDATPSAKANGPFRIELRAAPWVELRLYGFVGARLTMHPTVTLSAGRTCEVAWVTTAEVQAVVGPVALPRPIFTSPPLTLPLPAALAEGRAPITCLRDA
jgi:hypothetical protein